MQADKEMSWNEAQQSIRALKEQCARLETAMEFQHAETVSLGIAVGILIPLLIPRLSEDRNRTARAIAHALRQALTSLPIDKATGSRIPNPSPIESHLLPLFPDALHEHLRRTLRELPGSDDLRRRMNVHGESLR